MSAHCPLTLLACFLWRLPPPHPPAKQEPLLNTSARFHCERSQHKTVFSHHLLTADPAVAHITLIIITTATPLLNTGAHSILKFIQIWLLHTQFFSSANEHLNRYCGSPICYWEFNYIFSRRLHFLSFFLYSIHNILHIAYKFCKIIFYFQFIPGTLRTIPLTWWTYLTQFYLTTLKRPLFWKL